MIRSQWEKEIAAVKKEEIRFLKKQNFSGTDLLNQKIGEVIPFGLEEKLEIAFRKSFAVIFELGNKNPSATPEGQTCDFDILQKNSNHIMMKQTAFSCAEGIALGALGIGLPDIPIFIVMLNGEIKKIAESYGFPVKNEREKIFILKIITAAFADSQKKKQENFNLGKMTVQSDFPLPSLKKAIESAAKSLAEEMLYLKFVQGIPLVGILGGISNPICIKKASRYADLIYKKRFLYRLGKEERFI